MIAAPRNAKSDIPPRVPPPLRLRNLARGCDPRARVATILLSITQAPGEYRAFPKRTREALVMAARRTILIDGPRWIQWSIRGGGAGVTPRAVATPAEVKKAKGRKTPKAWPKQFRKAHKLLKRIGLVGGRTKPKVKNSKPPTPKTQKAPAGYRVPIDTGDYANSWTAEPTEDGAVLYSAASPAIKAGVIEVGRRPGVGIPIGPLQDWVRRKLGVKDPDEARGIAIRISWQAKHHGRPGLHVLGRAAPKIAEAMVANTARQLKVAHAKAAELYAARAKLKHP